MKIEEKKNLKVIVISDGTGETATEMARAAITQFKNKEVFFTRYKNVRTKQRVQAIFQEASIHHDIVVYTIVSIELRTYVQELSRTQKVRSVDLLGPLLNSFSNIFETEPDYQPGLLHQVNDEYFKKVAAVEFTLNHDDGRNLTTLEEADVILVGISRTSKTPLSIYLSLEGIKVVNIPIVKGSEIPEKLFKVDQRKIFGLTIDPSALHEIRRNRLTRLGMNEEGEYADIQKVTQEVEWANNLFNQNKRWPVFNVTGKALEETAAEIIKLLNMRKVNRFKQDNRFKK
ncbi:MAG: kinase/pyrophosphorylase [Bacteriovoracaceae bacterium]|jgi:regulator of PEP synthase PpsR (kinase-PPPase family)|nr:kinase/pyrophosphorylase [Bacteriovoracaceae bacterium]